MCFTEREIQTFILKFGELFSWSETGLKAHGSNLKKGRFLSNLTAHKWQKLKVDSFMPLP